MVIIFLLMPNAVPRIKKMFSEDLPLVFAACAAGAFLNLTLNAALSLHDAASVLVISEVFLVLVLVGEHTVLKEREQTWVKLVSIVLAIAGAILVDISR
jgi:drug/metabolite transporter (DMT)-like permease